MPDVDLVRRVEMLEKKVESLQRLPSQMRVLTRRMGSVESQVLQLRTEMRSEFSAIRREMATKSELRALRDEVRTDIAGMGRELADAILKLDQGQSRLGDQIARIERRLSERGDGPSTGVG